jgi:hypothetical protein
MKKVSARENDRLSKGATILRTLIEYRYYKFLFSSICYSRRKAGRAIRFLLAFHKAASSEVVSITTRETEAIILKKALKPVTAFSKKDVFMAMCPLLGPEDRPSCVKCQKEWTPVDEDCIGKRGGNSSHVTW